MAVLSIDTLMKLDRKKVLEVPTREVKAKHLSKLMGEDVSVKIRALSGETYTELLATAANKKGTVEPGKAYKTQSLIVAEAMIEPSLKDKELQNHFGAVSPAELAGVLFPGGEMVSIFTQIADLSGYGADEDTDEEVKN